MTAAFAIYSECGYCSCMTGECRARSVRQDASSETWFVPENHPLRDALATFTPGSNADCYWEDAVPTEGHAFPAHVDALEASPAAAPRAPVMATSLGHPNPHRRLWRPPA